MLLRKGEVHSRLKDNDNISFSKEVAETLGIESAIILEFCKSKRINFSNNINDLLYLIKKELPFIDSNIAESSINKLISYKLIANSDDGKKTSNYRVQSPTQNNTYKTKIDPNWMPSKEAIRDIKNESSFRGVSSK